MHQYERCGAMGFGRKRRKTKVHLTFEQMRMTFHRMGFPISMCGPDTQPAEDAPIDLDYELPTAGTAAAYFDSPPGHMILSLAGHPIFRRRFRPAVAVNDDGLYYMSVLLQQPRRQQQHMKHNHPQQTKHRRGSLQKKGIIQPTRQQASVPQCP